MLLNWIEQLTSNQQVGGSSPPGVAIFGSVELKAADLNSVGFLIETIAIRKLNMTTFFDNQIDLFDLNSAGPEPADWAEKSS